MLTQEQLDILLRPLNGSRVAQRTQAGVKLSYLEAWDVKAHMTRIFGFCNWDSIVSDINLVSCENDNGKWTVCYQATVTVHIRDENGQHLCTHAEAAVGTSTQGRKGEAMDMALKTAESDAFKRACINLGTQFGLSLYNNGSTADVIRATLVTGHNTSTSSVKTTVTVEETETVQEDTPAPTAPPEALEAVAELASYVPLDSKTRIMNVAKWKSRQPELLQHAVIIDDQEMTLARYADLVASGKFSDDTPKENTDA